MLKIAYFESEVFEIVLKSCGFGTQNFVSSAKVVVFFEKNQKKL
jgi:hypothetical protein